MIPSPLNYFRRVKRNMVWLGKMGNTNLHMSMTGKVNAVLIHQPTNRIIARPKGRNLITLDGAENYAAAAAWALSYKSQFGSPVVDVYSGNGTYINFNTMILGNPAVASTPADTDVYNDLDTPIIATERLLYGWHAGEGLTEDPYLYPITNDQEVDNSGAGVRVVSWKFTWFGASFILESPAEKIKEGVITTPSPSSGTVLLSHFVFDGADYFWKDEDTLLKIFINHTFAGA